MISTHRFRWAELQMSIFLDENSPFRLAEDVISKLDRLDDEVGLPDLDLVYDEIYQKNTRVGTRDRENVMKTFKFLLCSFIEWNVHDLATAISLGEDGTLNLAIDASYVLDICSNFLVIDYAGYVQFAHLSVPEYLKGGRSAIVFSDIDAHAQIAEICLAYVMSPDAQETVREREVARRKGSSSEGNEFGQTDIKGSSSEGSEFGQTDTKGMIAHVEATMNIQDVSHRVPSRQENLEDATPTVDPSYSGMSDANCLAIIPYVDPSMYIHKVLNLVPNRQETFENAVPIADSISDADSMSTIPPCDTIVIPPRNAPPDRGPLGLDLYASALCLEHCELASMVKRQEGTLCVLFTTFMSVMEIHTAFLTWIQPKPDVQNFPMIPLNWTAQIGFDTYRAKKVHIGADPFLAACVYGFSEILRDLPPTGHVDVDKRNKGGLLDLWFASKYGHLSVVELLLDKRVFSNINDCLYEAVLGFYPDVVALLLSRGADASARFNEFLDEPEVNDGSLLHDVARSKVKPIKKPKVSSIVSLLLKHGVSIEATDSTMRTALHVACLRGNLSVVSILLDHGAFLGARDDHGCTPLMSTFSHPYIDSSTAAVELLLKKMSIADIVRRDNYDTHSALSLSLREYEPNITLLLLNTVDLLAARELGTQEGDEFVELSQVLKRITYAFLSSEWRRLLRIARRVQSQRSVITCLRAIAERIHLDELDWDDADLRDRLRKEGVNPFLFSGWPCEKEEDDTDHNDHPNDGDDTDDDISP